jgi:uncharacterized protein
MPISVTCPTCGAKLKTPDTAAGKKIKCPKCEKLIDVPAEGEEAVADVPAAAPDEPEAPPEDVADVSPEGEGAEVPEAGGDPDVPPAGSDGRGGRLREDDMLWGLLAHLAGALFGWLGALIVFLIKKDESTFLRHHSKESLNFQLTLIPVWVLLFIGICCGGCMGQIMDAALGTSGLIRFGVSGLTFLLCMGLGAGQLILAVLQGLKAKKGEWSKYPFAFRLIK